MCMNLVVAHELILSVINTDLLPCLLLVLTLAIGDPVTSGQSAEMDCTS